VKLPFRKPSPRRRFDARKRRQKCRKIFDSIYESYLEAKSVNGTMTCAKRYQHFGQGVFGSAFRLGFVTVSLSDFIADVELAAQAVLEPPQLRAFHDDAITETIREKMGKAFLVRKMFPLQRYFKPQEVRIKKESRQ